MIMGPILYKLPTGAIINLNLLAELEYIKAQDGSALLRFLMVGIEDVISCRFATRELAEQEVEHILSAIHLNRLKQS